MPVLKSLYWKLTLAFMLVAFITAGLVAVFIRATSADRLMRLIIDQQRSSTEQILADYYAEHGSWEGIGRDWWQIQMRTAPTMVAPEGNQNSPGEPPPPERERRSLFGLASTEGRVIVPIEPEYPPGALLPQQILESGAPILVDGAPVGVMLIARRQPGFDPSESLFLQRTNQALMLAMLGALLVALVIGVLLARTLTRPLRALTNAAQNIAQGKLEQEVKVSSQDEIGRLAFAFNRMSQEVARVNQLRRQMTADIAHDLRTPLTVIVGYIESMRDGVLKPTPQRFDLIYTEIERLQNLVGDLRVLSQADAGELPLHLQPVAPQVLLARVAELFQHQAEKKKVVLSVEAGKDLPEIWVDEARMMQVMDNLLSNAFRYTPQGGSILLQARKLDEKVELIVQDSGSGIDAEELPNIFDRFHRADKSRHAEGGESGLGLSIVKALVEAQGGRVWAVSAPGAGTSIHLELPLFLQPLD